MLEEKKFFFLGIKGDKSVMGDRRKGENEGLIHQRKMSFSKKI